MAQHTEGQMTYIIKAYEPKTYETESIDDLMIIIKGLLAQNYKNISVEKGEEE